MNNKRHTLLALKYMPVLTSGMMFVHIVLTIMGHNYKLADCLGGLSLLPAIILLLVSHALRYCWLHKLLTLYTLFVSMCIDYNKIFGFEKYYKEHLYMSFFFGIVVLCLFIWKRKKFTENCCGYERNVNSK